MLQSRHRRRVGTALAVLVALTATYSLALAATPPAAQAASATYYVDGASIDGPCSDAYTAAQAQSPWAPWCTIGEAVATVPSGSTIKVESAVYHEQVTLTSRDDGVTLQGTGSTRPVIDGDWTRAEGIELDGGVQNVTINGFEIRDLLSSSSQTYAAGIVSLNTANDTIENNVIHGSHGQGVCAYGIMLGNNDSPGLVHNVDVRNNHIYDIGPGGESIGIWLLMTTSMTVEGNEVYLVRKEGIRDWYGLDNTFTSNRLYLNWVGIALESAVGDLVDNNVAYANVWGYNPKHVSESSALTMWHLATGQWSRFWHNTAYANTHADIALGMNPPNEDYIDIRDNVFASPGDVHLHDFPAVRGSNMIVDYNVYSGTAPIYYTTWNTPHPNTYTTLAALQAALGWEANGQIFTPHFENPTAGNFNFSTAGLAPGVTLPDAFGAQLGAAKVRPATMPWRRYPTNVIASTPEPSYMKPAGAGDGRDDSYWWSANYNTNASVTFDLGAPEPVNTFVLDVYAQDDTRNPQGYSIQVSNDNVNFTTVASGCNPDSEGSSYKYTLAAPVTARYVRLNILTSFGGATIIFSDFEIGLLSPGAPPAPSIQTGASSPATGTVSHPGAQPTPAKRKPHSKQKTRQAQKAHRKGKQAQKHESQGGHGKRKRPNPRPKPKRRNLRRALAENASLSQRLEQSLDQLVHRFLEGV